MQLAEDVRNAMNQAIEDTIGTAPILRIRSGAAPASCASADSGTVLAEMTLPSDWMGASASGIAAKLGTWEDSSANATGTAGHFRVYESTGTTCKLQGTMGAIGSGADGELDNVSITTGQSIVVTSATLTAGNA